MAGDVNDLRGGCGKESFEAGAMASPPRGIQDDGGASRVQSLDDGREQFLDGAADEFAILDATGGGVGAGGEDCGFVEFDADERIELGGGGDAKEPDAAVGVNEMSNAAVREAAADGAREFGQQMEIVLEKRIVGDCPILGRDAP